MYRNNILNMSLQGIQDDKSYKQLDSKEPEEVF